MNPGPTLDTTAKQQAALDAAYASTTQVQNYNAGYGPNSNSFANTLLLKCDITVKEIVNPTTGNRVSIPGWSNTGPYFPNKNKK